MSGLINVYSTRFIVAASAAADSARHVGSVAAAAAAELPDGAILSLDKELIYKIIIQLVNVSILIAVLVFILYKPVKKYLANRARKIRDELENSKRIREEALELREKYEGMIAGIEAEREEILRQTHRKAVEKSDQLLFEARREVEVIHNRAKSELEAERENMSGEIKRQIIEIAHIMAGRFVRLSIDRDTQDRLIEQALADWDSGTEDADSDKIGAERGGETGGKGGGRSGE